MLVELSSVEAKALRWFYEQNSPVFSFKKNDPEYTTVRSLASKRLVRVQKVIPHPDKPHAKVSCFTITRKGKRYYAKLVGNNNE